jgi:hypothetical protein
MRIFYPHIGDLAFTVGTPSYVYSAWSNASVYYAQNAIVRYEVSSVWYDYQCRYSHTSSAGRSPTHTYYWTKLGAATTVSGHTYTTNVRLSAYDTWTAGQAVNGGSIQFDPGDRRDYYAALAITAGNNTTRPSEAVLSSDEAMASRWELVGSANAWAPFDKDTGTKMEGADASGVRVDPTTFSFTCTVGDHVEALIFAGMNNVKKITAAVSYGGMVKETLTATITPSGTSFGITPGSKILDLETAIAAGTLISVAVTLDAQEAAPIKLGLVCFGTEFDLAETEWGLAPRILSFSRKERNATFGTTQFVKRGSATQLAATCYFDTAVISGDVIFRLLQGLDGEPIMMDFNNASSDYDNLRVFGFFTEVNMPMPALSHGLLNMTVESLLT